jgi:hypothetical protein
MSQEKTPAAPSGGAASETSYREIALQIFVRLAARIYGSPAAADAKRPEPKLLASMAFKMAEAFEAAERETDRARAVAEARSKAAVKLDEVDLTSVIQGSAKK